MRRSTLVALILLALAAGFAAWLLLRGEADAAPGVSRVPSGGAVAESLPHLELAGADGHTAAAPTAQPLAAEPETTAPAATRTVAGHVLREADRSPLANAALWAPSEPEARVFADTAGAFRLAVPAGDAELLAQVPRQVQPVRVPLPAAVAELEVVLDSGWILPGLVLDALGHPLQGARVALDEERFWESPLQQAAGAVRWRDGATTTGADGSFRMVDLPYLGDGQGVEEVEVDEITGFARAAGAGTGSWRSSPPQRFRVHAAAAGFALQSAPVDPPTGPVVASPVELRLPRGGAIEGHVTDLQQQPLPDVRVLLVYAAEGGSAEFAQRGLSASSAADGRYRIEGVAPGRYVVAARPPDRPQQFAADIEVSEGRATTLDFTCGHDLVLEGRVVDSAGQPVEGADVDLRARLLLAGGELNHSASIYGEGSTRVLKEGDVIRTEIAHRLAGTRTDAAGRFRFEGLAPGPCRLLAFKPADATLWRVRADVLLDELVPPPPPVLVLPRAVRVAGVVLDEAEGPVAAAAVEDVSASWPYGGTEAWTDAQGRFALAVQQPGRTSLAIGAEGFLALQVPIELTADRDDVRIHLQRSPTLRGVALDALTLAPVASYMLTVLGKHSMMQTSVQDAQGAFSFEWGEAEPVTVWIQAAGYKRGEAKDVDPKRTADEPARVLLERE